MKENINLAISLKESIKNETLSHAYIFEGQDKEETSRYALDFVKAIFCASKLGTPCNECNSCVKFEHENMEDFIHIKNLSSSVKDEDVVFLQNRLKNKPFSAFRNIAVVENADMMTTRAQNRLLKTLEEPNGNNIIILLATNIGNLLPTIQSRCVSIKLGENYHSNVENENLNLPELKKLANMIASKTPLYQYGKYISNISKDRFMAKENLEIIENWFREILVSEVWGSDKTDLSFYETGIGNGIILENGIKKETLILIIESIEKAKIDLNNNINVAYALKTMLLKIQEDNDDKCNWN